MVNAKVGVGIWKNRGGCIGGEYRVGNGARVVVHENDLLHLFFAVKLRMISNMKRETRMENRRARRTTFHTFHLFKKRFKRLERGGIGRGNSLLEMGEKLIKEC